MPTTKEIKGTMQHVRAQIQPNSFNKEARTFEVVFATETPVRSYNWDIGEFMEILSCDAKNVRMQRANQGLPVFDSHYPRTAMVQLGRAANIQFANKEGRATITLGARADEALISDLENGIIQGISVGYNVYRYMPESIVPGQIPIYRAVDWEPGEISFAPVQADPNSSIRNKDTDGNHTVIIDNYSQSKIEKMEETQVSEETREQKPANPAVTAPAEKVDVAKIREDATNENKSRLDAILKSTRAAKLEDSFAIELFTSDKSIEDCRQAVIDKFAASDPKVNSNHSVEVGKEAIEKKREAAEQAILHRVAPKQFDLTKVEGARDLAGLSVHEIACVLSAERSGKTQFIGKLAMADAIFSKRTQSTSDFPLLLEGVMDKLLRADYQFAPEFWDMIAKQTSNQDFRAKSLYQVESVNGMKEVQEGGEIPFTYLKESKQSIKVKSYAEGIRFTRQAYINDDLNAFSIIPNRFVLDWNTLRGDLVWAMITGNVTMDDAKALFHTDHKNILSGAGSALDDTGLTNALKLFRAQTGLDSKRKIRVSPKFLIVSPDLEVTAKKLLSIITPVATANVNIWANSYTLIVEPRLSGNVWYLAADPSQIDGLYYSYLQGNSGLRSNREDDFDSDSIKFAVRSEFGVAAIDYRGWLRAAGDAPTQG